MEKTEGPGEKVIFPDISSKTYLLFNNGVFFFRFANGAFGSKWCGLWNRDIKYLDYFAFKVNGEWLSPDKAVELYYNGITALHKYRMSFGEVVEKITLEGDGLSVRIIADKPVTVEMEIGVNIRRRDENITGRAYEVEKGSGVFIVGNSLGKLIVSSENGDLIYRPALMRHMPGVYAKEHGYDWQEDEQEKFVPGIFVFSGMTPVVKISTTFFKTRNLREIKQRIKQIAKSMSIGNKVLAYKLSWNLNSFFERELGHYKVYAGYPYFNQFWTRDFLWMAKELYNIGFKEEVLSALRYTGSFVKKLGYVPVLAEENGGELSTVEAADSTPLWVIRVVELLPEEFSQEVSSILLGKMAEIPSINHRPDTTWMDTLRREGAIEIYALWAKAFLEAGKEYGIEDWISAGMDLIEYIKSTFWQGTYFKDSIDSRYSFTINSLVPFFLDLFGKDMEFLSVKKMREELVMPFGIKAVSKKESKGAYHERVWGLSTYIGLEILKRYYPVEAWRILKGFMAYMGSKTLFALPETISDEGAPKGATHQLWSSAFIPRLYRELRKYEGAVVNK